MCKKVIVIGMLIAIILWCTSCGIRPSRSVTRSFYYWKTVCDLDQAGLNDLEALRVNRLYIRFFDVVWDQGSNRPIPVSIIQFQSKPPVELEVVPVVFVTVEALERLPLEQCGGLAEKIHQKISFILNRNGFGGVGEIQMDCDWNNATRGKYFTLLDRLRELVDRRKTKLSATIRLHQVKYASRTGVPPVDRGMLMFYNFESPKRADIDNSILDLKIGRQYTSGLKRYPLPLDVSLPLFSWGVLFQDNHFQGLIGDLRMQDLEANARFRREGGNWFRALTDCRIKNIRILTNDRIRVEESRYAESLASARYLAGKLRGSRLHMALFHFEPNLIEGVGGREKIGQLYDGLR